MERRFRKIRDRLAEAEYSVRPHSSKNSGSCSGNSDISASANRLSAGKKVSICPKFFVVGAVDGPERQAGIIIHEIVHSLGLLGKTHKKKFSGRNAALLRDARVWAHDHPQRARRNPDSYEAFTVFKSLNS